MQLPFKMKSDLSHALSERGPLLHTLDWRRHLSGQRFDLILTRCIKYLRCTSPGPWRIAEGLVQPKHYWLRIGVCGAISRLAPMGTAHISSQKPCTVQRRAIQSHMAKTRTHQECAVQLRVLHHGLVERRSSQQRRVQVDAA